MTRTLTRIVALPLAAILVVACSTSATPSPASQAPTASSSASASASAPASASASASESASASASASAAATVSADCQKGTVKTLADGKLTIGTDNPAYPPYFQPPASGNAPKPWELGDPTNGEGFESAVAYAVAGKLGFTKDNVAWTVVKFDNSYAPGKKPFDFYLAQVSYTADRAAQVDMSDGYYFVAQSVVALKDAPITKATKIGDLKSYKLGAMQGTTAYDTIKNVISPSAAPNVYNDNDTALKALQAKQIDGIVVDLPTAFYMTAAQMNDKGTIVGQLPVEQGPNAEHFSLVLAKGSPLTTCVNQALASLKADGTLDEITKTWLSDKANAPVMQP